MKKITVYLLVILISINVTAQQTEGISQAGKALILMADMDFTYYIKQYVEDRIIVWQQKGEFEKTDTYKARVNEQSRKAKADEFTANAIIDLKQKYVKLINWEQCSLQKYDADNETYLLSHPNLGEIAVLVDIASAPFFKQNFNKFVYSDINFVLANNKLNLTKLKITDKVNNKAFYYSNEQNVTYVAQNIEYNFSDIDVNVPQSNQTYQNNSAIEQQDINIGIDPVDTDIPSGSISNPNTFALVIGNEKYDNERNVPYAVNDATTFKKYAVKTLGLSEDNVHLLNNATLGQILGEIKWITDVAKAYQGKASLIVYYAGHGMPDENSKDAYLLPVDGSSEIKQTAVKLEDLYSQLSNVPTKQVTVLLDACFSGAARDGMLAEGRGVKIKPKENILKGNFVVLSAASGEQTAYPYKDKEHGLFTYYLLKKLQETKGDVDIGSLSDYVNMNVSQKSVIKNNKSQTPKVNVSYDVQNTWRSFKLAY
ncbi:MAG: caspase family protein [Bacteroidales bacterium]|nr:caspase family protein [Bacteroidales bacterium]